MKEQEYEMSYSSLWKSIIRPPRDTYTEELMGENLFKFKGITYLRKDYDIINNRGEIIKGSFVEPDDTSRVKEIMPIIIYLHGNSSSRMEGLRVLPELLKRNINLFVFDFAGCGLSEGEYISLGWHETDDLNVIINFVEQLPRVGKIGLWGRSMGAATALIYNKNNDKISATCYDSPFCNFTKLAKELSTKHVNLPSFLVSVALTFIRSSIQSRNGLDIYKLNPEDGAPFIKVPGLFIHAKNDELISLDHTLSIYEKYNGEKNLNVCDGSHNSIRNKQLHEKIADFFQKYLCEI